MSSANILNLSKHFGVKIKTNFLVIEFSINES